MKRAAVALAASLVLSAHAGLSDTQCLASAIHYEAGGESISGKRAVYEVILNRAKEAGSSVCGIVTAPGQFSWYGFKPFLPLTNEMRELLGRIKAMPPVLPSATKWFFTTSIKTPKWARGMSCQVIGRHRFCEKENKNNGSDREVRDQGEGAPAVEE